MSGTLGAAGITQLASIVSGVLVARSLGPEDRGYLALLVVVSGVCTLVGSMGVPSAVTYYIAQEPGHARGIVRSLLGPGAVQVAGALVLQVAMLVALVVNDPGEVKLAAAIAVLLVPGYIALFYGLAILQGQQRFTAFNLLRIFPTIAYVAGVLAVFLAGSANLVSVMALWAGSNFFGGLLALGVAVLGLPAASADATSPSRSRMAKFGLKSFAGSLSPVEAFRLDQGIVGLFLSPVALGLYVVGQAITALPRVVGASIGLVAYPQVASQHDPADARRALWKYFFFGFAVSAIVVGALELASARLVPLLFGDEFADAVPVAQILLLATLFMAARRVLTDGTNGIGHPGLGTLAEIASWVALVPAVAILLPRLGVEGVAWALTIAWAFSLLFLVFLLVLVGATGWALPANAADRARRSLSEATRWRARRTQRTRSALSSAATAFATRGARGAKSVERSGRQAIARVVAPADPIARRDALVLVPVIAASAAAGIAVAAGPLPLVLGVVAAVGCVTLFLVGRTVLAPAIHRVRVGDSASRDTREPHAERELAIARKLYYGGLILLGFLGVRGAGQVAISDILFLLSFIFACLEFGATRRAVPVRLPFMLLFGVGLFSIGGILSNFGSQGYISSTAIIVRLIFLTVIWFWLGAVVLTSRRHVMTAITLWVASAALGGAGAILQLMAGDVIPESPVVFGRSTGFTTHPNELGALTAIALVPAFMLAARDHISTRKRVVSYGLLLLVGTGLILSGSVSALLAAVAAVFAWLALSNRSRNTMRVYVATAVGVIAITTAQGVLGGQTPWERFVRVTDTSYGASNGAGSLQSRIATYQAALARIDEQPFLGVGLDLLSVTATTSPTGTVVDDHDVHNLVIGTWFKTGLLGVLGILIAFAAIFREGWKGIVRGGSADERAAALALFCAVVGFVVFAMGQPVLYSRIGWICVAFVIALRAVQHQTAARAAARVHEDAKALPGPISLEARRP